MSDQKVWLVGRYSNHWELLGIYDDREKAIARCTQWDDFVGEAALNEDFPEELVDWDVYYPLAVEMPEKPEPPPCRLICECGREYPERKCFPCRLFGKQWNDEFIHQKNTSR